VVTGALEATWVQMPVGETAEVSPKYDVGASAVLVYRGDKVFILVEDTAVLAKVLAKPDVQRLSVDEMRQIERGIPGTFLGALIAHAEEDNAEGRLPVRLGDVIRRITVVLRIRECGSCAQRHNALNRFIIWRWWRK
jgi:hypothetical protein